MWHVIKNSLTTSQIPQLIPDFSRFTKFPDNSRLSRFVGTLYKSSADATQSNSLSNGHAAISQTLTAASPPHGTLSTISAEWKWKQRQQTRLPLHGWRVEFRDRHVVFRRPFHARLSRAWLMRWDQLSVCRWHHRASVLWETVLYQCATSTLAAAYRTMNRWFWHQHTTLTIITYTRQLQPSHPSYSTVSCVPKTEPLEVTATTSISKTTTSLSVADTDKTEQGLSFSHCRLEALDYRHFQRCAEYWEIHVIYRRRYNNNYYHHYYYCYDYYYYYFNPQ